MASGKKKLWITKPSEPSSSKTGNFKNLKKTDLGGVIFGCTNRTINECLKKQIFGLPALHITYVQNIVPGLPLFLFNYSDRKLHGIFEAASCGQMNIDPYGWTVDGSHKTKYPAQVQVHVRLQCHPLSERQFQPAIADNYYQQKHFCFELSHLQASKLVSLLASGAVVPHTPASQHSDMWRTQSFSSPGMQDEESASADITASSREDVPELELVRGPSAMNATHQEGNDCIGLVSGSEQKPDGSLSSASESQPAIAQLIQGIEELKSSREEQSQMIRNLEKNLFQAEKEIQLLKDRCMRLESMSNPLLLTADKDIIDTSEELSLDPTSRILLVGGYDGGRWLPSLDSYEPYQNIVKSLSPANFSRSHASVAWLNDELYAFGGSTDRMWHDTVESYSVANDQWVMRPSMGKKRGSLAGASLNGKLYAVGGGNGTETFSDVEMLDLDLGRWISTRSMLERRFGLASAELNGVLYVSGGYDGTAYLNSAERFDPREHSWQKLPTMWIRRGCHSMVALDEKLYAFGGCNKNQTLSSTEVFDPRLGLWMPGESMNRFRAYAGAAVVHDAIYVIGGLGDESAIIDTVDCFVKGRGWQETTSAVWKRCFLSAIVMQ